MTTIIVCMHCKTKVATVAGVGYDAKGRFCQACKTKEKREEMDKHNREVFKVNGLPEYHCKYCEGRKKESE